MLTMVEKILNEIAEGDIEIDEGDIYRQLYPVGLPRYLGLDEHFTNRPS